MNRSEYIARRLYDARKPHELRGQSGEPTTRAPDHCQWDPEAVTRRLTQLQSLPPEFRERYLAILTKQGIHLNPSDQKEKAPSRNELRRLPIAKRRALSLIDLSRWHPEDFPSDVVIGLTDYDVEFVWQLENLGPRTLYYAATEQFLRFLGLKRKGRNIVDRSAK